MVKHIPVFLTCFFFPTFLSGDSDDGVIFKDIFNVIACFRNYLVCCGRNVIGALPVGEWVYGTAVDESNYIIEAGLNMRIYFGSYVVFAYKKRLLRMKTSATWRRQFITA